MRLGLIAAEEKTIGELKLSELAGGGVVPVGVGGRAATTVAQDAGEFGEKQALRDVGLLGGNVAATAGAIKSPSIAARLGFLGEDGIVTAGGIATAGIGTFAAAVGKELISPAKAGNPRLEENAIQRAAGLNFTKSKAQLESLEKSFSLTMTKLRTSAALGIGAIDKSLSTGLQQADETWIGGTKEWRHHTTEAMEAAVSEIRKGMKAGTIGAEEGKKEINRLLAQIKLVKGNDPFGLAEATTKQFKSLNEISASGLADWTRKLERMPEAAREKSRKATEGMLEEWAKGHPKLEAQIENLTDYEIRKFGATNKQIREGVRQGATGPVAEAFKEAAEGVAGALENIKVNANDMLKVLGVSSLIKFRAIEFGPSSAKHLGAEAAVAHHHGVGAATGGQPAGSFLSGTGLRDTVPVWAAPGEAFLTRHQQPEVQVGLALAKAFGIGQNGSLEELFAHKRQPHYMAQGGITVSGPRETATIAHAVLKHVAGGVDRYIGRHSQEGRSPVGWSGHTLTGKVSWFNGGATAGGRTTSDPGVALNLHPGTEGGWDNRVTRSWMADSNAGHPDYVRVEIAGHRANLPIIDLGPAGFTHRAIDVTEGGVRKLGFSPSSFPTDAIGRATVLAQRFAAGGTVGTSTRAIAWARHNIGTQQGSKKEIKWADETGGIIDPWCAEFVGADMKAMGLPLPANPAYSGSYSEGWAGGDVVGHSLGVARLGDLLNFENEHIGIYVGGGRMISGNWSNEVAEARVSEDSHGLSAVIRPHYAGAPGGTTGRRRRGGARGAGGRTAPIVKPVKPQLSPGIPIEVGGLKPTALPSSAAGLPPSIKSMLQAPGLSFAQKLSLGELAVNLAGETTEKGYNAEGVETSADTHHDDIVAAQYEKGLVEAQKKHIEKRLKEIAEKLKKGGLSTGRQSALLKEQGELQTSLGSTKSSLHGLNATIKGGAAPAENEPPEPPSRMAWANAELAEAELTKGTGDDIAVQQKMLGIAEEELATAKANNDPEAIAAAAQQVKQLRETLEQSNGLAHEQLVTSSELALAELTPEKSDDEAAEKKLLSIAEQKLQKAKEEDNYEAIISAAGEVKPLREVLEASNEIQQQREGFEKEQLEVNKRLAKIAEEQGPAFMGAFVAYLDGAIGGPVQTNSRLATAGVAADYQ